MHHACRLTYSVLPPPGCLVIGRNFRLPRILLYFLMLPGSRIVLVMFGVSY